MATGNVNVYVIDVGQGQCTYVEVLNTSNKIIHALLFDCGSDKYSDEAKTNLDWIAARVLTMDTPGFDGVFFSHSDKDHTSLTRYLVDKIAETKAPVISLVWYAGAKSNYTKSGFNILNYLVTQKYCTAANEKTTQSDYTGYDYKTTKTYTHNLWQSADAQVKVFPIVSNVLSSDPDWEDHEDISPGRTAEVKNRVSMVCSLQYAGASYTICGDATHATMGAINNLFSGGTTVFDKNNMTTLPHHGSRATGFAVKSSEEPSFASILVVNTFATLLKSQSITISAYEKHRHPSLLLMSYFIPTITTPILRDPRLNQKNTHLLTAYIDRDLGTSSGMTIHKNVVYSFETQSNRFATRYYDGAATFSYEFGPFNKAKKSEGTDGSAINKFACWVFQTQTNGSFLLGGHVNLDSGLFTSSTVSFLTLEESTDKITKGEPVKKEKPESIKLKAIQVRKKSKQQGKPVGNSSRLTNRLKIAV